MESTPPEQAHPSQASATGHAIVIGSSMAGLTAARVLLDHFERVTVLERDRLPEGFEFRKGVPQGRHPHILLIRGQEILEQFFPGLSRELEEAGAVPVNFGLETRWFLFGRWRKSYPSALVPLCLSRPLLEETIRRRLAAHPRVRFLHEAEATGLEMDREGRCVTGVRFRSRAGSGGPEERIAGELVVDASGRDSHAPEWLKALGYPAPEEMTINSFPGYATRIYQRTPTATEPWKVMAVMPTPPNDTRGALIMPMEGGRCHVTMIGMGADYPPTDEAGFMAFARSLPTPKIHDTLLATQPLGPIIGYRRAENRLRHYDRLPRYLEGFLVFGDAVFALNPVYAQGMTVVAIEALTLDQCLRERRRDPAGLARSFQRALAKVIANPWQMATGEDRRWPRTEGGSQLDLPTRLIQRYIDRVLRVMGDRPDVAETFYQVQHMLRPPTLLFRPDIVLKVLLARPDTAPSSEAEPRPEPKADALPPTGT